MHVTSLNPTNIVVKFNKSLTVKLLKNKLAFFEKMLFIYTLIDYNAFELKFKLNSDSFGEILRFDKID